MLALNKISSQCLMHNTSLKFAMYKMTPTPINPSPGNPQFHSFIIQGLHVIPSPRVWRPVVERSTKLFISGLYPWPVRSKASSITLAGSNRWPWNTKRFLCCHIELDNAIHHRHHLLWFFPPPKPSQNWAKWAAGLAASGPTILLHLRDSHHSPLVNLQLKNKWPSSSW